VVAAAATIPAEVTARLQSAATLGEADHDAILDIARQALAGLAP
jgi:hypothetical protein